MHHDDFSLNKILREEEYQKELTQLYHDQLKKYAKMQKKSNKKLKSTNHVNFKNVGVGIRDEIHGLIDKYKKDYDFLKTGASLFDRRKEKRRNGRRLAFCFHETMNIFN